MPDGADRDLELALLRLAWRIDALDAWRKELDVWCGLTSRTLEALTKADEIAEAVAAKMDSTRQIRFTKAQLTVAYLGLACAVASPFVAWVHG